MPILNSIAYQLLDGKVHLINVSPLLPSDLDQYSLALDWVEDKEGEIRELFKVLGYPTMFVLGADSKIAEIIPGVPDQLKAHLLTNFIKPNW